MLRLQYVQSISIFTINSQCKYVHNESKKGDLKHRCKASWMLCEEKCFQWSFNKNLCISSHSILTWFSTEQTTQNTCSFIFTLIVRWWSWPFIGMLLTFTGAFTGPALNHSTWVVLIQLMILQWSSRRRSNIRWERVRSAAATNGNNHRFSGL